MPIDQSLAPSATQVSVDLSLCEHARSEANALLMPKGRLANLLRDLADRVEQLEWGKQARAALRKSLEASPTK